MKRMNKITAVILTALTLGGVSELGAHVNPGGSGIKQNNSNNTPGVAAGCTAAKTSTDLDFNNVVARIHTGGDMWWDLTQTAVYEVPAGSGKHSLFAGSLWLGGQDVNGQLKIAAMRFRDGIDFWTGPLNTSTADIDPATCAEWDKHFVITRTEVDEFNAYWEAKLSPDPNDDLDFIGYSIPESITEWPAHGTGGQSFYLAPFYDRDGDGLYNPEGAGDYPLYDINNEIDCTTDRREKLYGDKTLWWIFNDKGNVHTETGGAPIGMEIHAQAFAFATSDEINNMTFYNYRLINRSTFTLTNTYFGVWTDADLGHAFDDYVGCDVMRGLGYAYNGYEVDGSGGPNHYGSQPPAVGVDFFEGPYQDNDGIDNNEGIGPNEALNGLGYGDSIVDNERFGMRRFLYFNNIGQGHPATTDPSTGADYYNFLRSFWKDQTKMFYGGTGHQSDANADQNFPADFMFPGNSDPLNWGTGGVDPGFTWTEESASNVPYDRRFVQSAGPFTLNPGAVNDITVGIVWARATSGGPMASVEKLRLVDDKAQSLFENCFRVLNGPDAPDVAVKELDREIILTISNRPASNNYGENYSEIDPFIPESETITTVNFVEDPLNPGTYFPDTNTTVNNFDRLYRFQGYQIFQVKDDNVTTTDLYDPDKARLIAQVDKRDSVGRLINFIFDENLETGVPQEMVNGSDRGILHSFRITEDEFASGDKRLVNHKTYYYLAIAYAYNQFKPFDPNDPFKLDGQQRPYLAGRKGAVGGIQVIKATPHIPLPQNNGTILNSIYGEGPYITRMEGTGNGGNILDMTRNSEEAIMSGANNWTLDTVRYLKGHGPINVKVIDPLSVPNSNFKILFEQSTRLDTATWRLIDLTNNETYQSDTTIQIMNEQLFPELGLSVTIEQAGAPGTATAINNGYLEATIDFSDSRSRWLTGIPDTDGAEELDWVLSGTGTGDFAGRDDEEVYEKMGVPFMAPFPLVGYTDSKPGFNATSSALSKMENLKSVDIVITSDKSKWSRVPVIEISPVPGDAEGAAAKGTLRNAPSVGKDGQPDGTGNGYGWFPGYAICQETGERLNMAFGENSALVGENGRDMLWNPTSAFVDQSFDYLLGGMHYFYVFDHSGDGPNDSPSYDEGQWMAQKFAGGTALDLRTIWRHGMWVGFPMLEGGESLLASDVRIRLRVSRPYEYFDTFVDENNSSPHYTFSTSDMAAVEGSPLALEAALALINVVPNPYYAFSEYESNQLENTVKIVNLPEECKVSIYTLSGTLIRRFNKADPSTSLDWDLNNHANIPIASGIYLIHVDVPGVGERVLKWFGIRRPVDLQSF